MKLGTAIPTLGPTASPEAVRDISQAADELGYETLWCGDHLAVPRRSESMYVLSADGAPRPVPDGALVAALSPLYEQLTTLAYVAGITKRVKIGSAVNVLPIRNPVLNARQLATIDVLSGGRLVVGVGAGWLREEADALQVPWDHRGARTDEHIQVLRAIWTSPDAYVSFSGQFYSFQDVAAEPRPHSGGPPILIGGHSRSALKRAARLGDGWLASNATPAVIGEGIAEIRRSAEALERDPARYTFVTAICAAVDARGRLVAPRVNPQRRGMTGAHPDPDPPDLIETLRTLNMCDQVIVQPDAPADEAVDVLRRVWEEVDPALP
jgi:probable F420-dependent oxidoreductase